MKLTESHIDIHMISVHISAFFVGYFLLFEIVMKNKAIVWSELKILTCIT